MNGGTVETFPLLGELPGVIQKRFSLMISWFDKALLDAQILEAELPKYREDIDHIFKIHNEEGRIGCLYKRYSIDDMDVALAKVEASIYLLDHPSNMRRSDPSSSSLYGYFGVLPTLFVRYPEEVGEVGILVEFIEDAVTIGKFVHEGRDTETIDKDDKQRIVLLDIRFCNLDRNRGNILVKKENNTNRLIPIDHEMCLPVDIPEYHLGKTCWKEKEFGFKEVLNQPFSKNFVDYVMEMNADEDLNFLRRCGWIPHEARYQEKLKVITIFLKKAVARELEIAKIARFISMEDVVCLHSVVSKIEKGGDDYFSKVDDALDEALDKLIRLKL